MTERFQVELEGAFCASIADATHTSRVITTGHELNDIDASNISGITGDDDLPVHSWNDAGWTD